MVSPLLQENHQKHRMQFRTKTSMKSDAAETNKKVDDYSKQNEAKVAKLEKQSTSSTSKLNNLSKSVKDL